jgi:hypothetical protein
MYGIDDEYCGLAHSKKVVKCRQHTNVTCKQVYHYIVFKSINYKSGYYSNTFWKTEDLLSWG